MRADPEHLPVYNSTRSLSIIICDYSNVFVLPAICVFGLLTSIANIIVLCKLNLGQHKKLEYYHLYMLITSVSEFLFLLTQVFVGIIRCGTLCSFGYSYAAKFYELYVYLSLGYAIITFSALVDISVSIDRIRLFNNSKTKLISRRMFALRCAVLFVCSAVVILPDYVFTNEIVPRGVLLQSRQIGNETWLTSEILYQKALKNSRKSLSMQIAITTIAILKGPALIGLVLVMSIIVVFKYKAYRSRRIGIFKSSGFLKDKEGSAPSRTTYMIIAMSITYFLGNILDSLEVFIEFFDPDLFDHFTVYVVIGNVFLFGSHSLYIFIYYRFDKPFKAEFQRTFLFKKAQVAAATASK